MSLTPVLGRYTATVRRARGWLQPRYSLVAAAGIVAVTTTAFSLGICLRTKCKFAWQHRLPQDKRWYHSSSSQAGTGTRSTAMAGHRVAIAHLWDGKKLLQQDQVQVSFSQHGSKDALIMEVSAPFYNDPAPPSASPGACDQLWDYEVVEAFFLASKSNEYLEVELGPHGHHLLLMLRGPRNMLKDKLALEYSSSISDTPQGRRWTGSATIPFSYLPAGLDKFNAYSIHGSGQDRRYCALFPATETHEEPDYHRLQYFQPFPTADILPKYDPGQVSSLWADTRQ